MIILQIYLNFVFSQNFSHNLCSPAPLLSLVLRYLSPKSPFAERGLALDQKVSNIRSFALRKLSYLYCEKMYKFVRLYQYDEYGIYI